MTNLALENNEAVVNITWAGQNGEMPDPVFFESTDADLKDMVTEAVRSGDVPGIRADAAANFTDFVVDRFRASEDGQINRIFLRPKTPFGHIFS